MFCDHLMRSVLAYFWFKCDVFQTFTFGNVSLSPLVFLFLKFLKKFRDGLDNNNKSSMLLATLSVLSSLGFINYVISLRGVIRLRFADINQSQAFYPNDGRLFRLRASLRNFVKIHYFEWITFFLDPERSRVPSPLDPPFFTSRKCLLNDR